MKRGNDIIKALEFVALYAAYLEESVDVVMERLSLVKPITDDKERKWPTRCKIKWCKKVLKSLRSEELNGLVELLDDAKNILKRRNEVMHGRIYAGYERNDILKSGRSGVSDRKIMADELYNLKEDLFELQAEVPNSYRLATERAIKENIT